MFAYLLLGSWGTAELRYWSAMKLRYWEVEICTDKLTDKEIRELGSCGLWKGGYWDTGILKK